MSAWTHCRVCSRKLTSHLDDDDRGFCRRHDEGDLPEALPSNNGLEGEAGTLLKPPTREQELGRVLFATLARPIKAYLIKTGAPELLAVEMSGMIVTEITPLISNAVTEARTLALIQGQLAEVKLAKKCLTDKQVMTVPQYLRAREKELIATLTKGKTQ